MFFQRFFEHLKKHYEPGGIMNPVKQTPEEVKEPEKPAEQPQENERQESLLSSLLNLTCIECNKTFRRQKTFEAHMRDIHSSKNEPIDEFSEPEDLMEGECFFFCQIRLFSFFIIVIIEGGAQKPPTFHKNPESGVDLFLCYE